MIELFGTCQKSVGVLGEFFAFWKFNWVENRNFKIAQYFRDHSWQYRQTFSVNYIEIYAFYLQITDNVKAIVCETAINSN